MRAFSLVELSIVLVILGLLTGGILAGQSLIRAAELRSVTSEQQRWVTAVGTFRDKYMAIPGDMREATRFWNRQVVAGHCVSNHGLSTAGTPGTCDGNGDGVIAGAPALSQSGEFVQFWRQLANAGLIEGTYTGIAGSGGALHATTDNSAMAKLGNASWMTRNYNGAAPFVGTTNDIFAGSYGNVLQLGAFSTTADNVAGVFKPEEIWNIDTKMDDGKPATGSVMTRSYGVCTNGTGVGDTAANYQVATTTLSCIAMFVRAF